MIPLSATNIITPADLSLPTKFTAWRKGQESTILSLESSDLPFSLYSAPPGSGKTLTYISLALLAGYRTLILVSKKSLQQQLMNDFSSIGLFQIQGHSDYDCADLSRNEDGGMDGMECSMKFGSQCPYEIDVELAKQSQLVTTNYAHWVQLEKSEDPDRIGKFDLIVLDEAHLVDLLLVDLVSIDLHARSVFRLLQIEMPDSDDDATDINLWRSWAESAQIIARERYVSLSLRHLTRNQMARERSLLTRLDKSLTRFLDSSARYRWVSQPIRGGVKLSPVWSKDQCRQYLYRDAKRCMLVSGTLSPDTGTYLGIPESSSQYIEVPSTFAAKRRPFIHIPTTKVDYKMSEGQRRILGNQIDDVIRTRLDRKGLIHSRSYRAAEDVKRRSKHAPIILTHDSRSTREIVHRWLQSLPPAILASPVMEEGQDLIGDLCRYQIVYKVPFVDSRDPIIAARTETDKKYKYHLAAMSVLQMYMRSNRSEDDWSETFIFDNHWQHFRRSVRWPQWFKAAWIDRDRTPAPLNL